MASGLRPLYILVPRDWCLVLTSLGCLVLLFENVKIYISILPCRDQSFILKPLDGPRYRAVSFQRQQSQPILTQNLLSRGFQPQDVQQQLQQAVEKPQDVSPPQPRGQPVIRAYKYSAEAGTAAQQWPELNP